jgi:hypothetical protein
MTILWEHDALAERLTALGDALDLDETATAHAVMARLTTVGDERAPGRARRPLLVAAAVVVLAVVAIVVQPDARHAVARWFGLDGVVVEIDPELTVPPGPASFDLPGPGRSSVIVVDGREILVSAIDGTLDGALVAKVVRSSDQIEEVDVGGRPGLWISGADHTVTFEVLYEGPDGEARGERVAADTLLWQDGTTLLRVEGFETLADALAFAEQQPSGT